METLWLGLDAGIRGPANVAHIDGRANGPPLSAGRLRGTVSAAHIFVMSRGAILGPNLGS